MKHSASKPAISTIVLNWNRADLLKRTLDSYISTITVPFEIFILDNASTDNSRDVIKDFCSKVSDTQAVFLEKNMGGEAINIALKQCRGEYVHISENDIEYLSGWTETVLALYQAFPRLGQLSLFGPVPEDMEVWEIKESALRYSKEHFLYEALSNVGTTSVLRREVFHKDIRIENIRTTGKFLFPDDAKLSEAVKRAGLTVAWAPFYLVRNLGHMEKEIKTRIEYYKENYRSKYWLGVTEFNKRLDEWERHPKPRRSSFLFPEEKICGEKSKPSHECSQPLLWSMIDGWTAEVETLEFLYALTRLVKPFYAVETGTWRGYAAKAIARGLKDNDYGKLVTLEKDSNVCQIAKNRLNSKNIVKHVDVLNISSLNFIPEMPIDFVLFDSDLNIRLDEFRHFQPYLLPGALILFHDVSTNHKIVRQAVDKLLQEKVLQGFFLSTPRGLAVCQYSLNIQDYVKTRKMKTPVSESEYLNKKDKEINEAAPVCIAGMHRSGTSMVTRLLNLCDLYLGSEDDLLELAPDNPEGFWENVHFKELNERILEKLGGSWDLPPTEEKGWEQKPEIESLKDKAYTLVKNYTDHKPWGWKDPRNSLTLPFWKSICPSIKTIICLRNPIEVARSLQKRGGTTDIFAYNLWYIYNKRVLSCTKQDDRLITHYDTYFVDPEDELRRILNFIGVDFDDFDDIVKRACKNISSNLKHNSATIDELINNSRVPENVKTLYLKMCKEAGETYGSPSYMEATSLKQPQVRHEYHSLSKRIELLDENDEDLLNALDDGVADNTKKELNKHLIQLLKNRAGKIIALEKNLSEQHQLIQDLEGILRRFKEVLPIIERLVHLLKTEDVSDSMDIIIGEICFTLGMINNARDFFERALQKNSSNPEALNNLGVISFRVGDFKDAEDFFIRALASNPEHQEAKRNLLKVREKLVKL